MRRKDKIGSIVGSANVFEDLGFTPPEAAALKAKSELHSKIVQVAKKYSQAELQGMLKETQPRVSDLMRGKISKFSIETLFGYAEALQLHPTIKTSRPEKVAKLEYADA